MKRKLNVAICLFFFVLGYACHSQRKNNEEEILSVFESKISRTEFSSLLFLTEELVSICTDTTVRSKFAKYLEDYNGFKRKSPEDEKEHQLGLHLLYNKISAFDPRDSELLKSREYLLDLLNSYKNIDFEVGSNLILSQLDDTKRDMVNGYDEGTTNESWLIFFSYDPILLKSVLQKNGKTRSWEKSHIRLCNTFRENSIPILIRQRLKSNIISHLKKYESRDIEIAELIKEFSKCDVSVNLYD